MSMRPWRAGAFAVAVACASLARADTFDDAQKLAREGRRAEALALADEAIAERPRDARMRFLKGVILSEQGRKAEAEAAFAALAIDFPELADPYNNLAVLYASEGRLNEALGALQAALRNDPRHVAARENLGDVYLALAIEAWAAAQAGRPADPAQLQRKLRLAREIQPAAPTPPPPAAPRPPG